MGRLSSQIEMLCISLEYSEHLDHKKWGSSAAYSKLLVKKVLGTYTRVVIIIRCESESVIIFARSALYVGERIELDSLSVCV